MDTTEKIHQLRRKGSTYEEIAEELDISKPKVRYRCQKMDGNEEISERNKGTGISFEFSAEEKQKIQVLTEYGISTNEVAEILGLQLEEVRKFVYNSDFQRRTLDSDSSAYDQVKFRRRKLKLLSVLYLGGECEKCGYDRSIRSLSFHHTNKEEKDFGISGGTRDGKAINKYSWRRIKEELNKCELLCSNCHMESHDGSDERNEIVGEFNWA